MLDVRAWAGKVETGFLHAGPSYKSAGNPGWADIDSNVAIGRD